ncbi:MAG TPA: DUF2269 family protein [Ktedonobacteraceae bacterium]|nr:DUF2269 family protein [Ktedonobacteraceae bacterium]
MSFYPLALFAHVLGVLMIFMVIGFEWVSLMRLRSARTIAQVREYTGLITVQERLLVVGGLLLLSGGLYMTATHWGWGTAWILVALVTLLMQGALAVVVHTPRFKAIRAAAEASEGSKESSMIPARVEQRISDPILWLSVQAHGITALGVLFLMTNKPNLVGSLITLAVALIISGVTAWLWRPRRGTLSIQLR